MNDAQTKARIIEGEITPARFARLTSHLRVNGKPFVSVLHRMEDEARGMVRRDPVEPGDTA